MAPGVRLLPSPRCAGGRCAEARAARVERHASDSYVEERRGQGLDGAHSFEGGDVILPALCLSFSSPEGVREFLNQGGNGALVEGPLLKVKKIRQVDGAVGAIYSVLLGAARLLRDFREQVAEPKVAKFRRPNACFRVRPERGAARRLINRFGVG